MKKATIFAILSIIVLFGTNVYYFIDAYSRQIKSQQETSNEILSVSISHAEKELTRLETEAEFLISNDELNFVLTEKQFPFYSLKRLNQFIAVHKGYLTAIQFTSINDDKILVLTESPDSVTFIDANQPAKQLASSEKQVTSRKMLMDESGPFGSIDLALDIKSFFMNMPGLFDNSDNIFHWVSDNHLTILYMTEPGMELEPDFSGNHETLNNKNEPFSFEHKIKLKNKPLKVISVFHPIAIMGNDFYIITSIPSGFKNTSLLRHNYVVGVLSILVIIISIVLFVFHVKNQQIEQARIKQSEGALKKVLYYLPSGVILVDKNLRIQQVNKAALRMFQLEDPEIITDQVLDEYLLFAKIRIIEKKAVSVNGTRYIIEDNNGVQRILFNEKIPFFLYSERYTIESYYELTPSSQSHSAPQAEFIANISHELRTPLNSIIGMTDLVLGSPTLQDKEKDMIGVAKRSANTLLTLINDVLDFSRLESGRFEIESIPFNLKEEIQNVINDFIPLAKEKRISINTDLKSVLPHDFIGDPVRIRQVMSNLMNNAIKFTPFGTILVSALPGRTVSGGVAVQISIKDSGIGIKEEKLKTIFDPFWQADQTRTRDFGGTGLGTTISKQLVSIMGGEIWAKSPSGISSDPINPGAEFTFTLPLKTKKYHKNLDFSSIISFTQIKALIITDDPLQVQVLTRNLIVLGLNFQIMPPATETLEVIKNSDNFHLLIIDHRFDLNGLEFLHEMHSHQLHSKNLIILQSNDSHATNTSVARRLGADVYLRKPIPLLTLKQTLIVHFPKLTDREKNEQLSIPINIKILIIDNNHLNFKITENLLRKLGYHPIIAADIKKSIDYCTENHPDLILLDSFLPAEEEGAAIKKLRKGNIKCPIVVMGTRQDLNENTKERYLESGADDFIYKPLSFNEVNHIIIKWGS
jgi:signal transduction histidine kinase/DNA-binding response OmpR family regulator